MDGGEISSKILIEQMTAYRNCEYPYDETFDLQNGSILKWWKNIEQRNNHIQKIALKVASIVPHQAAVERVFSILSWLTQKRRNR
jgi:hypothetical protein